MTPELPRLLSGLCDGTLTDAEHAQLEDLLARDEASRRVYLEYMDMHARLLRRPTSGQPAPVEEKPVPVTAPRSYARFWSHAAVALVSIAATLLLQFGFLDRRLGIRETLRVIGEGNDPAAGYIATLTSSQGCAWDRPGEAWRAGARLQPGEVRLVRGLAQIRFDTGADLILEAPTTLRLDTSNSATLVRGKVVFKADETAVPFDLRTPSSTLMDFGTEYAVLVNDKVEEVHVFEGEVQRTPRGGGAEAKEQQLKAGEARRYDHATEGEGQPTLLDAPRFIRRTLDVGQPDPRAALLAYEGFDYRDAKALVAGQANGGSGWNGPWVHAFARAVEGRMPREHGLNLTEGLSRPGAATPAIGGCYDFLGFTKAFRRLAQPVRLDADGVYYLSYLFRHQGPPLDPTNAVAILFWPEEDGIKQEGDRSRRLNLGIGGANQLFTHLGGVGSRTPLPLSYGETYLFVAKIAAGEADPDQVFIRIYAPREPVDVEEPGSWSVVGPQFRSDLVFDWLQLHINSGRRQTLDELRLGTTWASVTAPWISGPAVAAAP